MTVNQLIAKLQTLPGNMSVFVAERRTDFAFGLVNSVRMSAIQMSENPDGTGESAKETVIILDEE